MKKRLLFLLLLACSLTLRAEPPVVETEAAAYAKTLKKLTDVMVNDVTGPCASARYYAYANLAAYELLYQQKRPANYVPFGGLLRSYPAFTGQPDAQIDARFGSLYALLRMGEDLLPSGYTLEKDRLALVKEAKNRFRLTDARIQATRAYADTLVKKLVRYAAQDGYIKTSGYLRFTPTNEPGYWQPTPPAYSEAYEPHWPRLRPFLLDSASQFRPLPMVKYDEKTGSPFFQLAKEVYDTTRALTDQQRHIANFWDCNPFFLNQKGHVSFGTKKITPGGHWMGITSIVCLQRNLSLAETVRWHTLVGLTMADAFISCWEEKYHSNRIRPETFINQHLDRDWRPMLQTPPFPEYTSGHSVMSAAIATVLTTLAGGPVTYTDTVELEFGIPARSFRSFEQAASEAAVSRLYGGIHFRDSIENGVAQGKQIGRFFIQKMKIK
ncbi:vanadium-dependent haloperoxidase [Larkinella humicola]|uniref:Vanadium-dependent haloperoxidase n=1 Tax=Larkinella humicola TaxID=2607654 RepID=A0A5N1J8F6_9BACT|nr:vanadium-dependent haloperoxidase [Larkinella humicola]KAA9347752.1 vanadium-dependent haloperoxidase [Larkinella humicola]